MLSYRHGFHAGNHADVLKHMVLADLLRHLGQKDKPYWYIDTHAGAGIYALDSPAALKNAEFDQGIGRLWSQKNLPAPIEQYVAQVRALNPRGRLVRYPGSPQIALQMLRPQDRLRLFDMHTSDLKLLGQQIGDADRRALVTAGDGFAGLKALLPPPPRRALVLIDPSYEVREDYRAVVDAMDDSLRRFATGTYLVWYPLLSRREAVQLPIALTRLREQDWLQVELQVKAPSEDGVGMHGSGLFVFNPPWTLPDMLRSAMPVLVDLLGQDADARFTLQHRIA
jgi:23S rRNA (adenine2030-N6)-methyltransferase